jgi:hypothetical protein
MIGISQEANRPLCPLTYTYHGCPHLSLCDRFRLVENLLNQAAQFLSRGSSFYVQLRFRLLGLMISFATQPFIVQMVTSHETFGTINADLICGPGGMADDNQPKTLRQSRTAGR